MEVLKYFKCKLKKGVEKLILKETEYNVPKKHFFPLQSLDVNPIEHCLGMDEHFTDQQSLIYASMSEGNSRSQGWNNNVLKKNHFCCQIIIILLSVRFIF